MPSCIPTESGKARNEERGSGDESSHTPKSGVKQGDRIPGRGTCMIIHFVPVDNIYGQSIVAIYIVECIMSSYIQDLKRH